MAKLIITVSPQGELYVDGEHYGTTPPITTLELAPGMHHIEVRSGSRKPFVTYMTVKPGEERRIRHDFGAKPSRPPAESREPAFTREGRNLLRDPRNRVRREEQRVDDDAQSGVLRFVVGEVVQVDEHARTENLGRVGKTSHGPLAHRRRRDDGSDDGNLFLLDVFPNVLDEIEHPGLVEAGAHEDQLDVVVERGLGVGDRSYKKQGVALQDAADTLLGIGSNGCEDSGHAESRQPLYRSSPSCYPDWWSPPANPTLLKPPTKPSTRLRR